MVNVIDIGEERKKRLRLEDKDLTAILLQVRRDLAKSAELEKERSEGSIAVCSVEGLREKFRRGILQGLLEKKLISGSFFLCGVYIANLLTEILDSSPESWCGFDYAVANMEEENPRELKKGGDVCFLIRGVFPERSGWRAMNAQYYEELGRSFYFQFYGLTGKEIGYHMSRHFSVLAMITNRTVYSRM